MIAVGGNGLAIPAQACRWFARNRFDRGIAMQWLGRAFCAQVRKRVNQGVWLGVSAGAVTGIVRRAAQWAVSWHKGDEWGMNFNWIPCACLFATKLRPTVACTERR